MKWITGRQGGKYKKLPLICCRWFDSYLLKFDKGFKLPMHTDKVEDKKHYRLNILLYGEDVYIGEHIFRWWRIVLFRAEQPHGTEYLTRNRMLLSIGWCRKSKGE